jgi:2-oxoglutarate dehydrogenase E1 component
VRNSPLSENAALGFEYGYSVHARTTLVLWEAQYGDFVDGAQVVIDEFISSGRAKWGLESGLVLLLPHAWEGQGPDHSSACLERFLQLAAEDNLRIVNCSTAAQYFHLLRRQAASLRTEPRPLVVMTPKSLLRHPLAAARAEELAGGSFCPVLDDARAAERPERVRRLVLCSGKIWADVEVDPARGQADGLAVIRVEELYPFPADELRALFATYGAAREVVWLQEEPRNMGAWSFVQPRLSRLLGAERRLGYVGRPAMASPAEGWADVHAAEQRRLVEAVLRPEKVVSHAD